MSLVTFDSYATTSVQQNWTSTKDNITDNATTIKVIVIQDIEATDKEKFLTTPLTASRKYLFILLNNFIILTSFVILNYLTFI